MPAKKTLREKVVALHEAHVEEELTDVREARATAAREESVFVLGGIRAIQKVTDALSAQTIRALQQIRDERRYEALGFARFDFFMDQSPLSPMNYKKFNRLETALMNEGDELFNYLNAINAPMSKRRLLGKGTLAVEGEEIVIRDEKEEHRFPVGDRATLLTTLSKLADKCGEQTRKIESQAKKIKKGEEEFNKLRRQSPSPDIIVSKSFDDCLFAAVSALGTLAARVEGLTPEEAEAARARVVELISQPYDQLQIAFLPHDIKPSRRHARAGSLTNNVTQADVESLMES
jgi:hypothetical protein